MQDGGYHQGTSKRVAETHSAKDLRLHTRVRCGIVAKGTVAIAAMHKQASHRPDKEHLALLSEVVLTPLVGREGNMRARSLTVREYAAAGPQRRQQEELICIHKCS